MSRARKIAVQMDPIDRINIAGDSTFALLLEAQKRGFELFYYTPDKLSLRGADVVATAPLAVRDVLGDHFDLGPAFEADLRGIDVVLLRQDPPFDLAYITSTHLLEQIAAQRWSSMIRPACAMRRKSYLSWIFRSLCRRR